MADPNQKPSLWAKLNPFRARPTAGPTFEINPKGEFFFIQETKQGVIVAMAKSKHSRADKKAKKSKKTVNKPKGDLPPSPKKPNVELSRLAMHTRRIGNSVNSRDYGVQIRGLDVAHCGVLHDSIVLAARRAGPFGWLALAGMGSLIWFSSGGENAKRRREARQRDGSSKD